MDDFYIALYNHPKIDVFLWVIFIHFWNRNMPPNPQKLLPANHSHLKVSLPLCTTKGIVCIAGIIVFFPNHTHMQGCN